MNANDNLPPGCSLRDIDPPDEDAEQTAWEIELEKADLRRELEMFNDAP